jgi:pimeloyl-ACP methyl ester carboxylesterase
MAKTIEAKEKYINVNGIRLHYLDWGKRGHQPILLLHGFMAHAHAWDDFALAFRGRYRVIALDQRGHGESQWSRNGLYSIDDHFSDLAKIIRILSLTNLTIVGHSMGGRNALFYAACNPTMVEQLILVDIRPGNDPASSKALKNLLNLIPLQAGSVGEVVKRFRTLSPYLSKEICDSIVAHGFKTTPNGMMVPKFDVRMIQQLEKMDYGAEDLWPFLQNITCRSLVIRGERSPFLSRKVAQKICRLIPNAMLREIPDSTHFPVQEDPIVFNKTISDFLNQRR